MMLNQVQVNIHHNFEQVKLLMLALTHSSYSNEAAESRGHNERLEFLGDAVLELCTSSILYDLYPALREGELTALRSRLVSQGALAQMARELMLDKALMLGRGEEAQGGRDRDALLSDVFEAVLGAVFLDGGFGAAKKMTERIILPRLRDFSPGKPDAGSKDSKSMLQELAQKLFKGRPVYVLEGNMGPEHSKRFEARVTLPDGRFFISCGSSVKKAEQMAAAMALEELRKQEGV